MAADGQPAQKLYKVKLSSGRILGPMPLRRIRDLILKNHILGEEEAREYPKGEWAKINAFNEVVDLLMKHFKGELKKEAQADWESEASSELPGAEQGAENIEPVLVDPSAPTKMLSESEGKTVVRSSQDPDPTIARPFELEAEAPPEPAIQEPAPFESQPEPAPPSAQEEEGEKTLVGTLPAKNPGVEKESLGPAEAFMSSDEDGDGDKTVLYGKNAQKTDFSLASHASGLKTYDPADDRSAIANESTVVFNRPLETLATGTNGKPPESEAKKKAKFWLRIGVIGLLLGLGLSTLMEDEPGRGRSLSQYIPFRPVMPAFVEKADPQKSERLYAESLKFYALDHVEGYRKAAKLLIDASAYDPGNVKALALLASTYLNLIDSSNKDESYFGVIGRLIELAREKTVDLPEAVIADVEFMLVLSQYGSAHDRIVEYTRKKVGFGVEMFFYLSLVLYERGDAEGAARFISNIPETKVFSPKVYLLKGQIAEKLNALDEAYGEYAKALRMQPEHAKSRLKRIELQSKRGRLGESGEDLKYLHERMFLMSPKEQAFCWFLTARYHQLSKKTKLALDAIELSVRLDPKNSDYQLEFYSIKAELASESKDSGESQTLQKQAQIFLALIEGERLVKEGRYQDALASFLLAREADLRSPLPLIKAGDMFSQLNNYPNALLNYKKAFEMDASNLDYAGKYIRTLILSYEWDESLHAIERIRRIPKSQSLVDRLSGDLYARRGQYVQALTSYRNAMKRDVIDPEVYYAYGRTLQDAKEFKSAPFFYALALRFDPLNLDAVIGSAKSIAQSESIDRGIIYLRETMKRYGDSRPELLTALADLELQKGEVDLAQQTLKRVIQSNPEYPPPWKVQAQLYMNEQGRQKDALDKALDAWRSYSERNPADPSGYIERYQIFKARNQFDKAFEELNKVFAVYPKYPNIHVLRGRLYVAAGNLKSAVSEFEQELKNNPYNTNALIDRGKAYISLGNPVEAMKDFNQAMQLDPRSAEAKHQAGYASYLMKNYPSAVALYKSAIALDQGNPLLYKRLGIALRAMGDVQGSSEALRKYLDLDPGASDAKEIERFL